MERVLVVGGCGFLGSHLVQQVSAVCKNTHYLDVADPQHDLAPSDPAAVFHKVSLTDAEAVEAVFKEARPDTVFHLASMIDCRPRPSPIVDAVNVGGTDLIITLCKRYGVRRLIYTSSIEVMYGSQGVNNACDRCPEDAPYPVAWTQEYQRTKIAAEKLVLAANGSGTLQTVSLRPGHIFGPGDDLFFMASVQACFGEGWLPSLGAAHAALMSMVYVENMAAAHILAAVQLAKGAPQVAGGSFNIKDFDQNIVATYHDAAGVGPPWLTLPFWFLFLLVRSAVMLAIAVHDLFGGRQILHAKTGLHEAALTAGLPATMDDRRARHVLKYTPPVGRAASNKQSRKWVAGGGTRGKSVKMSPLLKGSEFITS